MRLFEKGPGFKSGLRDLPKHLNGRTISSAIISTIFGCTGPCLIVIQASQTAGFTTEQTVSWVFGIYVFGGLLGVLLSLFYKVPISGAYSIPGATLMGAALAGYTFNEAAGAFVLAGVIVLVIGVTGIIGKVLRILPLPIIMGMIAGCMLKFGVNVVTGVTALPLVSGLAFVAFLIVPRLIKGFPGVLAALIVGVLAAWATGSFAGEAQAVTYIPPQFIMPAFNPNLIFSCAVPLAALVIGAENAQAMGVLKGQGYDVPANGMTVASGIGGIVAGLVGAHNANIAGPMTAICSSEEAGVKEGRYVASVVNGITFALFGVVGSYAIAFVSFIPSALVSTLAGLAMINVLIGAFKDGFGTLQFKTGAFFALVVGASGVSILHIGSAFWALVVGVVVSLICDKKDFKTSVAAAR
jgi:benzoate membrane transport protein